MPFNIETGEMTMQGGEDYGDLTGKYMLEKMKRDPKVCMITSGTPAVGGFWKSRPRRGRQSVHRRWNCRGATQ